MTQKVKQCEDNIKKLSNITLPNQSQENIKNNMKITLASKIREFSQEFRINEEKYMKNYKELVGESDSSSYEMHNNDTSHSAFLQTTEINNELQKRNEEINTLLNSINTLASTFKDLQTLVQEQGTILDRIDYNIEIAADNTFEGHKQLVKAKEHMKNNCFRNATLTLLVIIFIESLMLLIKFT